jgi:CheY-like chemotaxis protein
LLEEMSQILATTLSPRIHLCINIPASLPYVHADRHQLETAFLNLAVNARDAMPDGGELRILGEFVCVKHGQYPGVAPGYFVRVSVTDTGCGMCPETLVRAIEPFFTTKSTGRGAGLGLSMTHGLMAQLGGALTLESAPGQGCTVQLLLPTANSPFMEAPLDDAAAETFAPGRVLLADDEDDVRSSVAQMLESFGQTVVEATCAAEAMALLDSGQCFDLVVTDHLMPGMSGVELARNIHTLWPEQQMLIITGYADIDDVAPEIPSLAKPFRHADLARILPALLRRKQDA